MLIALTRDVPPSMADCELTHLGRDVIDVERARVEHAVYERALELAGCAVQRLTSPPGQPDAVFIEDIAIVLDEMAIVTRPGVESRRGETVGIADALRPYRRVEEILAPACIDGGDVLTVGKRVYVGVGPRSNVEAIEQLSTFVAPHGYDVRAVSYHGCLHLKTAVTQVAPDVLLLNPDWVDGAQFDGMRLIAVDTSEPFAGNGLLIGDRVIYAEEFPRTRQRLEEGGVAVIPVPAGELAKAEGGVTCCSLIVRVTEESAPAILPSSRQ